MHTEARGRRLSRAGSVGASWSPLATVCSYSTARRQVVQKSCRSSFVFFLCLLCACFFVAVSTAYIYEVFWTLCILMYVVYRTSTDWPDGTLPSIDVYELKPFERHTILRFSQVPSTFYSDRSLNFSFIITSFALFYLADVMYLFLRPYLQLNLPEEYSKQLDEQWDRFWRKDAWHSHH